MKAVVAQLIVVAFWLFLVCAFLTVVIVFPIYMFGYCALWALVLLAIGTAAVTWAFNYLEGRS